MESRTPVLGVVDSVGDVLSITSPFSLGADVGGLGFLFVDPDIENEERDDREVSER